MDRKGCDIKPKGNHVHLQMVKHRSGHWYIPMGRFNDVMTKIGEVSTSGHLATASDKSVGGNPSSFFGRVTKADHRGCEY